MGNYVGNDAQNTYTLAATGIADIAWSADDKTLYASTTDGKIKVFDIATHSLTGTWSVGKSLGALSLSDDGKTLVAGGVTAKGDSAVFAIDTATGTKTAFKPAVAGVQDVEIVDNQRVLVSGNGSGQMLTLDLATGKFGTLAGAVSYSPFSTFTEDRHLTLIGEGGISNGPLFLYDDRTGTIVAQGDNYQPGVGSGFNFGIQAVSEAAGLVLQFNYYGSVNVYDLNLKAIKSYALGDGPATGYAFAPDGKSVYVYFTSGHVDQFSVDGWHKLASYTAPQTSGANGGYGNAIHVSADGAYISVYDSSAQKTLALIDLASRNETFKGTSGADSFAGGLGDDTYIVNNAGDVVTENTAAGNDRVVASIGYTLADNVETLQFVGTAALDGTGNSGHNTLLGNNGANVLDGGAGNDTLNGKGGIDTLKGGLGNDTYIVDYTADTIVELAGQGVDTVISSVAATLGDNLENLVLAGAARHGTGNALDNSITGNAVNNMLDGGAGNDRLFGLDGNDTLLGGEGNDTLDGGTGADRMTGGTGSDTYFADHLRDATVENAADTGTDTVVASIDWKLGSAIENLTLAPGVARLNGTGNEQANVITGNAGNNLIDGGAGADRMIGGDGSDTYIVDNAGDKVVERQTDQGYDMIQSSITTKLPDNVEGLVLIGTASINGTGNASINNILGNNADNVLDGGGVGSLPYQDNLYGDKGNDTYLIKAENSAAVFENPDEGTDRVVTSFSYTLTENVENLVLTGNSAISGGGNDLDNVITGNAGNNGLSGQAGNDTLLGGAGQDTLDGGAGNDILKGGAGDDIYIVNDSGDTILEKAGDGTDVMLASISATAVANIEVVALIGTDAINAAGNELNNTLVGNVAVNQLYGDAGDDFLGDVNGNDTLTGGKGLDTFSFNSTNTGNTSVITDFSQADHDIVSLAQIDANVFTGANEEFRFIGTAEFTGSFGEVRYEQKDGNTIVTGDDNGDRVADFTIQLNGLVDLTKEDFLL